MTKWAENVSRDVVRVLMEQYSSVAQALSELVDNPIDQRRGRRLTISLEIDKAKDIIVVEDHGGGGMDAADIAEWLNWGSGRERKSTDISRWRVGGKAACGYLGDDLVLYAKAAGSSDIWFFEDHDWATRSEAADWGEPQPLRRRCRSRLHWLMLVARMDSSVSRSASSDSASTTSTTSGGS